MDGAGVDAWSAVARDWAELWGGAADPVRDAVVEATGIGPGSVVLDVGCGSGEFLAMLALAGASASGVDPAPGMVAIARSRAPAADIRIGSIDALPWRGSTFDVVTAVNALQFAEDPAGALAECSRVAVPRGMVAVANWADDELNDLTVVEAAVAEADGEELLPAGDLRLAGGLEQLLSSGGLEVIAIGLVAAPWRVRDGVALVRAVLMGEDEEVISARAATVVDAASPFRQPDGSYLLRNSFRFAVGRTAASAVRWRPRQG